MHGPTFTRRAAIAIPLAAALPWPGQAGDWIMPTEPTNARTSFGDIAPHLAEITDKVLFGDVWENPALSLARSQPGDDHLPDRDVPGQRDAVPHQKGARERRDPHRNR